MIPLWCEREQTQCRQQSGYARVAEPERGCWLTVGRPSRGGQFGEVGVAETAVMSSALQVQDPRVDTLSEGAEVGEVTQTSSDAKVVGIVEGGLGAQGAPLLEILFDVAALVVHMQAGLDPLGHNAG